MAVPLIDLTGKRFTRILVIERTGNRGKRPQWKCKCDCGKEWVVLGEGLRSGNTKSCGCLSRENTSARARTHGRSKTKTYMAWQNAKRRCFNKNAQWYSAYGGRGITMSDRWKNSFEEFLNDMGEAPPGRSLDRMEVDGHYEDGNCHWGTNEDQAKHTRRAKKKAAAG